MLFLPKNRSIFHRVFKLLPTQAKVDSVQEANYCGILLFDLYQVCNQEIYFWRYTISGVENILPFAGQCEMNVVITDHAPSGNDKSHDTRNTLHTRVA